VTPPEELLYGFDLMGVDPGRLSEALARAGFELGRRPAQVAGALAGLVLEHAAIGVDVARRALGTEVEPRIAPQPRDRRFSDRAWQENPFLRGLLESYLVTTRWANALVGAAGLPAETAQKARFALGLVLDAFAPSNNPLLNPQVVKEAIDTGGLSLARGVNNHLYDLVHNGGLPRQVDTSGLQLGRTLAATPGRVVYRNDLFELIAYEPQTETVHAYPVVYSPAWINKYYVLDLAPGRSFVEFAVRSGFTVFAISYRNADESTAELRLDDYLRDALLTAVDRAAEITGAPKVSLFGVCTGGTLAAIGLGVLAARGESRRIATATLANTLVDHSEPGEIAVFADETGIEGVERRARKRGYVDESSLVNTFALMRGNDLIWRQVISSWYMGKPPPAFDVFAWSMDATRLPATMHPQFLRTCYLENALATPGGLEIDGVPVDLSRVETPAYVVAAQRDHVVPWRGAYRTVGLLGGEVRYVRSEHGHITGLVDPPEAAKGGYHVGDEYPPDADAWLRVAERIEGSWWSDWAAWIAPRSGEQVAPPALPGGDPAPGRYVHGGTPVPDTGVGAGRVKTADSQGFRAESRAASRLRCQAPNLSRGSSGPGRRR
jgi:poly[(R)-3-hydroxyalkanoate] polymerase subunit PhaC